MLLYAQPHLAATVELRLHTFTIVKRRDVRATEACQVAQHFLGVLALERLAIHELATPDELPQTFFDLGCVQKLPLVALT